MPTPIHVLILEDRLGDAELVLRSLRVGGFEPRFERVETEADYLARLDSSLDIILSDYHMPQFDALRALELLKQRALDIPFIIVSGTAGEEMAVEAMRRGASDYVLKEALARLVPAVERELREAKVRRERRALEEALAAREEVLDGFFDASPVGMAVLDSGLRFVQVNQTLAEVNGLPIEKHLGKTVRELLPQLAPTVERILGRVLESGQPVLNVEISGEMPSQPGVARHWVVSYFPIPGAGGSSSAVGAAVVEITDRKRAEERLRESEERFRELAENVNEVFWLSDPATTRILYLSPAYERVWGRTCQSCYEEPMSLVESIHPDDRERALQVLKGEKTRGGFEMEYRVVRPDGAVRWIFDRGFPIRNAAGEIVRVAGIAEDVTERKAAEERLARSEQQLHALAERLEHLREEERTRIARYVHDSLGQALTGLSLELSGLNERLAGETTAQDRRELRQKIRRMLQSVDHTIQAVQKISLELRPAVLDSLGLVAAIQAEAHQFHMRTGIHCQVDAAPPDVALDRMRSTILFRICQEILTNVARHSKATRVQIRVRSDAQHALLEVTDNGIGLTKKQVLNPASLGLLGMRERVASLGGEIHFLGRAGKGTKVTAQVPLPTVRKETE